MERIREYIVETIISLHLQTLLLNMIDSNRQLQQQCVLNILIDIKYGLVPNKYYDQMAQAHNAPNPESFLRSVKKQFHVNCNSRSQNYSTIIASNIFNTYLRPGGTSTKNRRYDAVSNFDEEFIRTKGWAGYKKNPDDAVIWVTPYQKLNQIIQRAIIQGENPSNCAFRFIGVLTNAHFKRYLSTFDPSDTYAYIIKYSSHFQEPLYQPNCTIANSWFNEEHNNLFVSFGEARDQYGRTYTTVSDGPAKERIHLNSTYFDSEFELIKLGTKVEFEDKTTFDRTELLEEAQKRLQL